MKLGSKKKRLEKLKEKCKQEEIKVIKNAKFEKI